MRTWEKSSGRAARSARCENCAEDHQGRQHWATVRCVGHPTSRRGGAKKIEAKWHTRTDVRTYGQTQQADIGRPALRAPVDTVPCHAYVSIRLGASCSWAFKLPTSASCWVLQPWAEAARPGAEAEIQGLLGPSWSGQRAQSTTARLRRQRRQLPGARETTASAALPIPPPIFRVLSFSCSCCMEACSPASIVVPCHVKELRLRGRDRPPKSFFFTLHKTCVTCIFIGRQRQAIAWLSQAS